MKEMRSCLRVREGVEQIRVFNNRIASRIPTLAQYEATLMALEKRVGNTRVNSSKEGATTRRRGKNIVS